jgi:hypothetical protein
MEKIDMGALLIHVDFHSDYLDPNLPPGYQMRPESPGELVEGGTITFDSFIKPALEMGIISSIAFCCNPKFSHNDYGHFRNYESPVRIVNLLQDFKDKRALSKSDHRLCQQIHQRRFILDIDLDFFLDFAPSDDNDSPPTTLIPIEETKIIDEIVAINSLLIYAGVTRVATSPEIFCSDEGEDYLRRIQEIFEQHFSVRINFDAATA